MTADAWLRASAAHLAFAGRQARLLQSRMPQRPRGTRVHGRYNRLVLLQPAWTQRQALGVYWQDPENRTSRSVRSPSSWPRADAVDGEKGLGSSFLSFRRGACEAP
jgi:hypothetical protein